MKAVFFNLLFDRYEADLEYHDSLAKPRQLLHVAA